MTTNPGQHATASSQTLDRGLRALELLAEHDAPLSITEFATALGVHRSNAYRILRTLEARRFVLRDEAGLIRLGPRLAALGRSAASTLQQSVEPALTELANALGYTSFVTVLDAHEVITVLSAEPALAHATVARRPGAKHSIRLGAPGHAIEAALSPGEHSALFGDNPLSDAALVSQQRGFAVSQDEVVAGVTSIAVSLRLHGEPPAALAVICIGMPADLEGVASRLRETAARIERGAH